jgi:hypothetical protein
MFDTRSPRRRDIISVSACFLRMPSSRTRLLDLDLEVVVFDGVRAEVHRLGPCDCSTRLSAPLRRRVVAELVPRVFATVSRSRSPGALLRI